MPPPTTRTEPTATAFLAALERSRLIELPQLEDVLTSLPFSVQKRARSLADALISQALLTHYQADKLLQGLWQGLVLGPYHVLAPLGRGGMGCVYLARDPRDASHQLLALKVLPPKQARQEANALARFRREIDLGRRLSHPNVTRTLDAGKLGNVHYIVMEYVPGDSLRRLVEKGGPRSAHAAAPIFSGVAAGLAHAHGRGLIHRDLKPANIMVTPDGTAKILDLGLALLMDEEAPENCQIVGGEGYIVGTMDYIAPEQTTNARNVGPQSDLYSLGASLFYTVTGVPPFPGGTAKQKLRWHRTEPPPPVRSLNPAVPEGFAKLIEDLLAKRPYERPASATEVIERLKPWMPTTPAPVAASIPTDVETVVAFDSPDVDRSLWEAPNPLETAAPQSLDDSPQEVLSLDEPRRVAWYWWLAVPMVMVLLFVLLRSR